MLNLPLVLYYAAGVLGLGDRGLARYGDHLLWVVVALQLGDAACDGGLLACGELVLASLAIRGGGRALFVFGVDVGIVAGTGAGVVLTQSFPSSFAVMVLVL